MIIRSLLLLTVLIAAPAQAADNAVTLTPSGSTAIRSKDVGAGVQSFMHILGDTSGNPLATVPGTPNAVFALPVQGVTGGVAQPVSNSGTFSVQLTGGSNNVANAGTFAVQITGATSNINNISGIISLPTGAATAANQATEITSLNTIATNITQGVGTSGATVPTNIIFTGCDGSNVEQTPVTNGQLIGVTCGLEGKLINLPYSVKEKMARGAVSTTGTGATTILLASGSGSLKTYVTSAQCSNSSVTANFITFNDVGGVGSGTTVVVPAGGTVPMNFPIPLVTAANAVFSFTVGGAGTTTMYCNAQGYYGT